MARIADDPVLAAKLRDNARAASHRYAWESIAARHLPVYGVSGGLAIPAPLPDNRLL